MAVMKEKTMTIIYLFFLIRKRIQVSKWRNYASYQIVEQIYSSLLPPQIQEISRGYFFLFIWCNYQLPLNLALNVYHKTIQAQPVHISKRSPNSSQYGRYCFENSRYSTSFIKTHVPKSMSNYKQVNKLGFGYIFFLKNIGHLVGHRGHSYSNIRNPY